VGALGDPAVEGGEVVFGERGKAAGHFGFAVGWGGQFDQKAGGGFAWDDGGLGAVAGGEEALEIGDRVTAFGFGGLVAALAMGFEDGPDLEVETDWLICAGGGWIGRG
jgi:hypothetical protein